MHALIGLGNPGKQYEHSRHNIGFLILDAFAREKKLDPFQIEKKISSEVTKYDTLRLVKPHTFMNNSGKAVRELTAYFHIEPQDILIIHDELDLPFGEMRLQFGRGAAGHNGVASIIETLETESFWRLRIGVQGTTRGQIPGDAYVLADFTTDEQIALPALVQKAVQGLDLALSQGPEKAQQHVHTSAETETKS